MLLINGVKMQGFFKNQMVLNCRDHCYDNKVIAGWSGKINKIQKQNGRITQLYMHVLANGYQSIWIYIQGMVPYMLLPVMLGNGLCGGLEMTGGTLTANS